MALRALGVIRPHLMKMERRMGDERGGHGALGGCNRVLEGRVY
jgi:hypothetical protein